jgi:hypothetical protein
MEGAAQFWAEKSSAPKAEQGMDFGKGWLIFHGAKDGN